MLSLLPARRNSLPETQPIDRFFDSFFRNWPTYGDGDGMGQLPGLSIQEQERDFVIHIDAPGFEAKDFNIQFSDNTLKLEAEHTPDEKLNLPFGQRKLTRLIQLPVDIDHTKVDAKYRSGVLTLTVAKAEKAQWKKIEVK